MITPETPTHNSPTQETPTRIHWAQIGGLAALQGSIRLVWIIYDLYVPQLLTEAGVPLGTAIALVSIENGIAALMEPLLGAGSDQLRRWMGSRFPLIAVGVLIASLIFCGIPWLTALTPALLPLILVAWSMAMNVFRSPAIALLGRYASPNGLAPANSALTLVNGLITGGSPVVGGFLLQIGPTAAFMAGSLVMVVAAAVLRLLDREPIHRDPGALEPVRPLPWLRLGAVFLAGMGVLLTFRLFAGTFPAVLAQSLPGIRIEVIIGIVLAAMAFPVGFLAQRIGTLSAVLLGIGGMILSLGLAIWVNQGGSGVMVAIGFGLGFSLVSNSAIPLALSLVSPQQAGLGVGLFFGGGGAAIALFNAFFTQAVFSLAGSALLSTVALLIAGGLLYWVGQDHGEAA